ncbi:hypothetical protein [Paraburkholderia sp. SIMBA_054]|uniref:hypothetical protein n=1 Tax=Paraburkholderia sp. SIMBA_054 TaxID=3085795 RepID=UPI00397A8B6E
MLILKMRGKELRILIAVALALVTGAAGAAGSGRYVVTGSDALTSTLVSRWAALDGRAVRWEASSDFTLHDAARLNEKAQLADAASLEDAFNRLSKIELAEKPDGPVLFACSYKGGPVALEVREVGQSGCGKPQN